MTEIYYDPTKGDILKYIYRPNSIDVPLVSYIPRPSYDEKPIHCIIKFSEPESKENAFKEFNGTIKEDIFKGTISIHEMPEDADVKINVIPLERFLKDDRPFFMYIDNMKIIKKAIEALDKLDDYLIRYFSRLILVNTVSLMESWLKLEINNIDPKLIKKFKSFQTFEYIRKGLKEVLDIEIDQDEILSNACIKRHEIIHRNSVLSDGDIIVITKDQLELIVKHLEMFINNLASKFREIKLDRYINRK